MEENIAVEEFIKTFMQRVGLDYNDIHNKKITFYHNAQLLNIHDKGPIKYIIINGMPTEVSNY